MTSKHGNLVEVGTLILKVASRCNLACDYCYIYTSKDTSWMKMPRRLPEALVEPLVSAIQRLHAGQETKPSIVLHGGEPLLAGVSFIEHLLERIRAAVPDANLSVQSNGTVYNARLAVALRRHGVSLSFSVDGFQHQNDKHRLSIKGVSAYPRIEENIKQALADQLLSNILMVVDFSSPPSEIYEYVMTCGVRDVNLILPDGDYNSPPPGILEATGNLAGEWLWSLFSLYAANPGKTRIRFFDDIVRMLLKKIRSISSPPVSYSLCTLTVDTDGTIKQSDTFRINGERADYIGDPHLSDISIIDVANSETNIEYLRRVETLCEACVQCDYVGVCGGGYPSHRLKGESFKYPSVYCSDYQFLFERIENAICVTQQN